MKELKDLKFKDHYRNTIKAEHDTETENPTKSKIKKVNILSNIPVVSAINKLDATKYRRIPINTYVKVPIKKCADAGPSRKNKYYRNDSEIIKDLMDVDD